MQVTQTLHRATRISGANPAVIDGPVQRSWSEFAARVARLAGGLRGLGIERGDRVAILMLNGHRFLELYYALPWFGALAMPINIRLAPQEMLEQLADAEARAIVVDDAFARLVPELSGKVSSLETILHASDGAAPEGTLAYESLVADGPEVPDESIGGDEIYGLFYTGGTTAASKGVMLTHTNIVVNAYNVALARLTPDREDVYLHAAPMFHLADSASTFAVTMTGGTHAFVPAFDVEKVLSTIQDAKITSTLMVPTMVNALVHSPAVADYDLSSLRQVLYGASPMPTSVLEKARDTLPCGLVQGYGMTETSPVLTFLPAKDHEPSQEPDTSHRLRSAGLPVPNVDLRILDPENREVPRGEVGEICAQGPVVMKGYWRKPDATAEAKRGGYMHTGDLGYMDDDGYVYLVDRAKDMIVSGGENVYSVEVETALYSHGDVVEVAVFGIPHDEFGEQVHAEVVVTDVASKLHPDDLLSHCRERIAGYKCPKSIRIRREPLPKSGAGKILKRELRAPYWEGEDRQIH